LTVAEFQVFHGSDYEEYRFLGRDDVWIYYKLIVVSYHLTLFLTHVISPPLKMEATRSSETSVYNKSKRRHIPEDGIIQL
jgi:hypothetical protein